MNLHTRSSIKTKSKKRIGRGGKRGTTSGRGQKGQRARAGHRIRPASRDTIIRTPKRRGFKNKPQKTPSLALSLSLLNTIQEKTITPQVLLKLRILRNRSQSVKIVSNGTITQAKEISGITVSKTAREKIQKAGGAIT